MRFTNPQCFRHRVSDDDMLFTSIAVTRACITGVTVTSNTGKNYYFSFIGNFQTNLRLHIYLFMNPKSLIDLEFGLVLRCEPEPPQDL